MKRRKERRDVATKFQLSGDLLSDIVYKRAHVSIEIAGLLDSTWMRVHGGETVKLREW